MYFLSNCNNKMLYLFFGMYAIYKFTSFTRDTFNPHWFFNWPICFLVCLLLSVTNFTVSPPELFLYC